MAEDAAQDAGAVRRLQRLEVADLALAEDEDAATSPWFDLSLGMEINGQRHNILPWLPDLIAAAANSPLDPDTGQPYNPVPPSPPSQTEMNQAGERG